MVDGHPGRQQCGGPRGLLGREPELSLRRMWAGQGAQRGDQLRSSHSESGGAASSLAPALRHPGSHPPLPLSLVLAPTLPLPLVPTKAQDPHLVHRAGQCHRALGLGLGSEGASRGPVA